MRPGKLIARLDRLIGRLNRIDMQYLSTNGNVHYKKALPPELWPRAEYFLRLMTLAHQYAKETGARPEVNLRKLSGVFTQRSAK